MHARLDPIEPADVDPNLLQDLAETEDLVGSGLRPIGVCVLRGVVHTWGECPYAPSIDGVLPFPDGLLESMTVREAITCRQCPACARNLTRNGMTSRWIRHQIDPAVAVASALRGHIRLGEAWRRCVPTGILPQEETVRLSRMLPETRMRPEGDVYAVSRRHLPGHLAHLLESGLNEPDGMSLVFASGQESEQMTSIVRSYPWATHLGHADGSGESGCERTARICMRLARSGSNGTSAWEAAQVLASG